MRKPDGYDQAQAFTGERETLAPGGYICKILNAELGETRSRKECLILSFDIAEGEHRDFYRRKLESARKQRPDAKWSGVFRQLTEGASLSFFKGLITSIEESNPGFRWIWDDDHALFAALRGKSFGGVFGREEFLSTEGKPMWATKCIGARSINAVREGIDPPVDKPLQAAKQPSYATSAGFHELEDDDGELPF